MRHYRKISDPGHGWLEVPVKDILELGVESQISPHSYVRGKLAYLEEDVDAPLFLKELRKREGEPIIVDVYQDPCSVREYKSFQVTVAA